MKRLISTASIGISITVIVLVLVVIDYKILKGKGFLHSNLRSEEDRTKVYNVDTMAIIIKKIDELSKKIERLTGVVERKAKDQHSSDLKKPNNFKDNKNNLGSDRFDIQFRKPDTKEVYPSEYRPFDLRINKPIIKTDSQIKKEIKDRTLKKVEPSLTSLNELFSLTRLFSKYEKERKERKENEQKNDKDTNLNLQAFNSNDTPLDIAKSKGINNKDDVLRAVREKFKNATDLTPKSSKEDENLATKIPNHPLFFHPISEMGKNPFDNIPNLTDFSGTISSTFVSSVEKGVDDKTLEPKVQTKVKVNLESKSGPSTTSPSNEKISDITDLVNNRSDSKAVKNSAKLENPNKKEMTPISSDENRFADPFNYRNKGIFDVDGSKTASSSMKSKSKKDSKKTTSSVDNQNENILLGLKKDNFADLSQSETDRQLEQAHLQKENEKMKPLVTESSKMKPLVTKSSKKDPAVTKSSKKDPAVTESSKKDLTVTDLDKKAPIVTDLDKKAPLVTDLDKKTTPLVTDLDKKNPLINEFELIEKELNKQKAMKSLDQGGLIEQSLSPTIEDKTAKGNSREEKSNSQGSPLSNRKLDQDKKTLKDEKSTPSGSSASTKLSKTKEGEESPTIIVNKSLHFATSKDEEGNVIGVAVKKNTISTATEVEKTGEKLPQQEKSEKNKSKPQHLSPVTMGNKEDSLINDRTEKLASEETSDTSSSSRTETALKKDGEDYILDVTSSN